MAISKEDVIRAVAAKVGPGIALEAKLEKGTWRITLTQEGKTASLEFKRGFLDDYFEEGEYLLAAIVACVLFFLIFAPGRKKDRRR